MSGPMGGAPNDPHTAAQAAVGAAEVHDDRCRHGRRELVGLIVKAMQKDHLRATAPEAVAAVDRFYQTEEAGEQITGEAFVHSLRRMRLAVVRERDVIEAHQMTSRDAASWRAEKAAILAWACPECPAQPGDRCINNATKQPYGERVPGHPKRIVLATRAAQRVSA